MRVRSSATAIRAVVLGLCLALVVSPVALAQQDPSYTSLYVGPTPAFPSGSTVSLEGLGTTSSGTQLAMFTRTDTTPDVVIARLIAKADLPAVTVFTDQTNTFSQLQTFSAGVASGFSVKGWLEARDNTSVSLSALGYDNVRLGVNTGTPRVILEDNGFPQWQIDNATGILRFARLTSAGASSGIPLTMGDVITVDPVGQVILPSLTDQVDIGSLVKQFRSIHAAELWVQTLVALDTLATTGGRQLVGTTTSLIEAISSSSTTIKTKHNSLLSGDRVYLEADGRKEWMAVTSSATRINTCTTNCDAESATGWTAFGGSFALAPNIRWQGQYGLLFTTSGGTPHTIYHVGTGNTAASTQYTFSMYLRRADGAAIVPSASDYLMICGDASVLAQTTAVAAGDNWYRVYATCTTSASDADAIGITGLPATTNHYVDALQIEAGAVLTPWSLNSASYSVTRDLDGSGANSWDAGAAVFDTGTTGTGWIDLFAVTGTKGTEVGPTICGDERTGSTYNAFDQRWCIGQLNGVFNYSASTWGAAFGVATATNVTVDATNGFRVRFGTTDKFKADTSGNLSLTGDLVLGTASVLHTISATAFGTGTGYWLDYNSGTPRFRVGVPGGDRVSWDGSALTVKSGNINIDSGGITSTVNVVNSWSSSAAYAFTTTGTLAGGSFGIAGVDTGSFRSVRIDNVFNSASGSSEVAMCSGTNGTTQACFSIVVTGLGTVSYFMSGLPTVTSASMPIVNAGGGLSQKSDGLNATTTCAGAQRVSSITFEYGIATAITCS